MIYKNSSFCFIAHSDDDQRIVFSSFIAHSGNDQRIIFSSFIDHSDNEQEKYYDCHHV